MTFDNLLTELIQEIVYQLDTGRDIKSLRLTNKRVNDAVEPVLWTIKAIMIDSLEIAVEMLRDLPKHRLATRARRLVIRNFPVPPPLSLTMKLDEDDDPLADDRTLVKKLLPKLLSSLVGLQSVEWKLKRSDPDWAWTVVMESLSSLPALARLSLKGDLSWPRPPAMHIRLFPCGSLARLEMNLVVQGPLAVILRFLQDCLSAIIQNNPRLEAILIRLMYLYYGGPGSGTPDVFDLHSIFEKIPSSKPLRLQTFLMDLPPGSVRITPKVVEQLKSLRCLEYSEAYRPFNDAASTLLWTALRTQQIHVRELTIEKWPCQALVDYLESFSGLETLSISTSSGPSTDYSDNLARGFWKNVIPMHKDTLKHITIRSEYTGSWGVGEEHFQTLRSCENLISLTVNLNYSPQAEEKDDIVDNLLTSLVESCERFRLLSVDWTAEAPSGFQDRFLDAAQQQDRARQRFYEHVQSLRLEGLTRNPHRGLVIQVFMSEQAKPLQFRIRRNALDGDTYWTFHKVDD
ncbi:hypothetical protein WG66_009132 [Moniliophthora roreri]|uniref:F-box domain-containing protein n=1 Tax=Moniliophthora roreri TaxID=221103 RepID=A0A0W0FKH5_MONRR|nr:hypothetical protein WG66_009132 [Moniliophthora roreri]